MAEINTGGGDKGGKKRSKKMSTKVDMTPMVDLAFLLITFFMLATTLQKQQIMQLVMPPKINDKIVEPPELKASNAITLILGKEDKVYWYVITEDGQPEFNETDFSDIGIRTVLLAKKQKVGDKLNVVIKPMTDSKYKNVVDIIDELAITGINRYIIDKISDKDLELVAAENGTQH